MLAAGIPIDVAIGDFDSIDPAFLPAVRAAAGIVVELPKRKDVTDLACAVEYVLKRHAVDGIVVYGGIGGRVDHLFANVNLMKRHDIAFEDDFTRMTALPPGVHRLANVRPHVSFFALEPCRGLSLRGFSYELTDYDLNPGDSLCVSNSGQGEIAFATGRLLVVASDDPASPLR